MGDVNGGLTSAEAAERLAAQGPNTVVRPSRVSFLAILREEVTEPMILLLLVVGVVYSLSGRVEDAATIFVVIALLVLAEVWNEYRAKRAISALTELTAPRARVLRDRSVRDVPATEVVPGDVVVLAVNSNDHVGDSFDRMKTRAREKGFVFSFLRD